MKLMPRILFTMCLLMAWHAMADSPGTITPSYSFSVDPSKSIVQYIDAYHGETINVEAAFKVDSTEDMTLFWQEQGMGDVYWSKSCETVGGGVYRAAFTPDMDTGAKVFNCFIGHPGFSYRCVFQLRMKAAPGAVPNEIPLPAKVIDFNQITVLNAPWPTASDFEHVVDGLTNKLSEVEVNATNAAVRAVQNGFRRVGDEYVYAPAGFGPFTWSGDRADAVAALGDTQPQEDYYDGEYVSWYVYFELNGQYFWGNAYANRMSPQIEFYFYSDYWDEDLGEWIYDSFTLTASRTATGWQLQDPVDTFAHQSDLTRAQSEFASMRDTLYKGETKVLRKDGPTEYGSGYGYLRKPLDSDFRSWRIRAPKCTVSGLAKSTTTASPTYTFTGGSSSYATLSNPISYLTDYAKAVVSIERTSGVYGSDSVELADFNIGLVRKHPTNEDAGFFLNFKLKNTSRSPRVFELTPVVDGFARQTVTINGRTMDLVRIPVTLPHVHDSYRYTNGRYDYLNSEIYAIYISADPVTFTNNTTIELHLRTRDWQSYYSNGTGTKYFEVKDAYHRVPITVTFDTYQLSDYILPEGRVVTDRCAGYYYDDAQKATYRIKCENGYFYTEFVNDKDWRKEDF